MGTPTQIRRYSIEEYFKLEYAALERHEYHDGEITLKGGGNPEHSFIAANIAGEIHRSLKGKPCRVANCNLRVRIPDRPHCVYPDASIICGPVQYDQQDPHRHSILNPKVVIEVLSPTSEKYDRGAKFHQYQEIDALEEYIIVSQTEPLVECWLRRPMSAWSVLTHWGLQETAKVRSLGIEIPMAEIYAGIDWSTNTSTRSQKLDPSQSDEVIEG